MFGATVVLLAAVEVLTAMTPCEVLPIKDAVAVLGPGAKQKDNTAQECTYEVPLPPGTRRTPFNQPLMLTARPWWTDIASQSATEAARNAKQGFNEMMNALRQNGASIKDESANGYSAFSAVNTKKYDDSQGIYILQGTKNIVISVYRQRGVTALPDLMDKLRVVAKRAAARL